jgi:hypothetical protein
METRKGRDAVKLGVVYVRGITVNLYSLVHCRRVGTGMRENWIKAGGELCIYILFGSVHCEYRVPVFSFSLICYSFELLGITTSFMRDH